MNWIVLSGLLWVLGSMLMTAAAIGTGEASRLGHWDAVITGMVVVSGAALIQFLGIWCMIG